MSNLLRVCSTCHRWIHKNPAEATRLGLTVSAHADKKSAKERPVLTFFGWALYGDDGGVSIIGDRHSVADSVEWFDQSQKEEDHEGT